MSVDTWAEHATSAQVSAYIPKSPEGFSHLLAVALVEKRMPKRVMQSENGMACMSLFEERYTQEDTVQRRAANIPKKPPAKPSKSRVDTPKLASDTQMAERKIASPRRRSRAHSRWGLRRVRRLRRPHMREFQLSRTLSPSPFMVLTCDTCQLSAL